MKKTVIDQTPEEVAIDELERTYDIKFKNPVEARKFVENKILEIEQKKEKMEVVTRITQLFKEVARLQQLEELFEEKTYVEKVFGYIERLGSHYFPSCFGSSSTTLHNK